MAETFEIKSGEAMTIPYKWVCENTDIGILCRRNSMLEPILLVQGISRLLRLKAPENKVDDLKTSKIVLIGSNDRESNDVHITCDIAAFTCHKISKYTPLQYLLSFNSPLLIHNYLPYFLEVKYQKPDQGEKLLGLINNQEILESYALDGENFEDVKTVWKVHMAEDTQYQCNTWSAILGSNNTSDYNMKFILNQSNEEGGREDSKEHEKKGKETIIMDEYTLKLSVRSNNKLINKYANFYIREKAYENYQSKKIVVFAQYAIVNKTDFAIDYGVKNKFSFNMKPHTNCFYDLEKNKTLNFRTDGYGNIISLV